MRHIEDTLQMSVADYLRYQFPTLLWFHTPNGGKRHPREAARLKRMGVLPGVADILLFWKSGMGAIELKSDIGRQRDTQKEFMLKWVANGGRYNICRSIEDVQDTMRAWGVTV